ncbi:hypothetical protein BH10PLA2_BH10PLA2_18060 [soil metagenome]
MESLTTPARTASGSWFHRMPVWGTVLLLVLTGCGTTRSSDTARTATEQLLISHAIDEAISELDCANLRDKKVFLDSQYLDGTVDKGYLISSLRQHLLAAGCLVQEERAKATYVVEARAGAIGTDRHALLVGVPAMTLPTVLPGQPSSIPEIPFIKKSDAHGVAKIAVFAYNRVTGERLWQSGLLEAQSDAKDSWIVGLGPFRGGSLKGRTELAGEQLAFPLLSSDSGPDKDGDWYRLPVTSKANWQETRLPPPKWSPLMEGLYRAISGDQGFGMVVATKSAEITGGSTAAPPSTSSSPTNDTLQAPINLPEINLQQVLRMKPPGTN